MLKKGSVLTIILAAGKGSRMKGFKKNKTCISLLESYEYPMILEILKNSPPGEKIIVVKHRKEDVIEATANIKNITYCEQLELNGTGGAILACVEAIEKSRAASVLITMGDVPLVRRKTYLALLRGLDKNHMMVLGFKSFYKKQYGLLELDGEKVKRIIEWSMWKDFSEEKQKNFKICNSGIYAVHREVLLKYIPELSRKPHIVIKERNGVLKEIKEFFLTDLVEYMYRDGLKVGYSVADETELIGVDDPEALFQARKIFLSKRGEEVLPAFLTPLSDPKL